MPPTTYESSNWSGYGVKGGPFTAVTGTFSVPCLTVSDTSDQNTSIWLGIDGWGNSNLIQAGVDEQVDPDNSSQVDVWPWWEVLPQASTPISTVSVSPGDTVTVAIWELGAGSWEISLTDDSNGQSFTTVQSYPGPGQSAEWIVESPENAANQQIYPLAPYTPAVVFSGLGIAGTEQGLDEVTLVQSGVAVSTPSAFDGPGFDVSYTGTEDGPEVGLAPERTVSHGPGSTGRWLEG